MASVDEVFDRIVSMVAALDPVEVELLDARGMVLAADVIARSDVPPFRNSAMDGFAVRSADLHAATGATLELIGTIAAGSSNVRPVGAGTAARIMTGAPVPEGADAVVRFEEVNQSGNGHIEIPRPVEPGENVRLAGEDVKCGDVVLTRGRTLGAGEIGVLAALNLGHVRVHRRPRVGILSTGDEVVELGQKLAAGQIRDANAYALSARAAALGAVPVRLGIAADRTAALKERLDEARDCDLILTSGGVSVGDFDLVKEVLRQEGKVDILTVRMKPGKPLAVGRVGELPLIGLPGNPVAAIVAFDQFARPAILKMLGIKDIQMPTVQARLSADIANRGHRRHFERGVLEFGDQGWIVTPTGIHGSAMLSSLLAANCYIVVDEALSEAQAGSIVDVQVLDAESVLRRNPTTNAN